MFQKFKEFLKPKKQEVQLPQTEEIFEFPKPRMEPVQDTYTRNQVIGQGSMSSVYKVSNKLTGEEFAMKVTSKAFGETVYKEVAILQTLNHPHIVRFYDFYGDANNLSVILELMEGGELFEAIVATKMFSERQAAAVMKQILTAVSYCHEQKIVHRDIKPEHLIAQKNKGETIYKLIGFETATRYSDNMILTQRLGTPYYIAPEVLKRKYNEKCDVWSCGVILFILLAGEPPFSAPNDSEILDLVSKGKFEFKAEIWNSVSDQAKNLIKRMLEFNPEDRISAKQALNDPWIQNNVQNDFQNDVENEIVQQTNVVEQTQFARKSKLQTAISKFVLQTVLGNQSINHLLQEFQKLDNQDGFLNRDIIHTVYMKVYPESTQQEIESLLNEVDIDQTGIINYSEFIVAATQMQKLINKEIIKQAFKLFDINGDGYISRDELHMILGGDEIDDQDWYQTLQQCDTNQDDLISEDELVELLDKQYKR